MKGLEKTTDYLFIENHGFQYRLFARLSPLSRLLSAVFDSKEELSGYKKLSSKEIARVTL